MNIFSTIKKKFVFTYIILFLFFLIFNNCKTKVDAESSQLESIEFLIGTPSTGNARAITLLKEGINQSQFEIYGVLNSFTDISVADLLKTKFQEENFTMNFGLEKTNGNDIGFVSLAQQTIPMSKNGAGAKKGMVEENFFVFDRSNCWASTSGPGSLSGKYSIVLNIKSYRFCDEFVSEAVQMADGAIFADTGEEAFGQFTHNKHIADPNNEFNIGGYKIKSYFSPQERPLNPLITHLLNATQSIRFMARAMSIDTNSTSRSHLLNVLQYKAKIPQAFNGSFTIDGIIDDETLIVADSIHAKLKTMSNAYSHVSIKKYTATSGINFNLYLIDENTSKPSIVFMSSDLRKVDGYDLTDAFMFIIEPAGVQTDLELFTKIKAMIDEAISQGVSF